MEFYQDTQSRSLQSVLRGLHYQYEVPQGKLIRVTKGKFSMLWWICEFSSTFGQHFSVKLSEDKPQQLWVPEGFAHGFFVLSETADLLYKTTNYYHQSVSNAFCGTILFLTLIGQLTQTQCQFYQSEIKRRILMAKNSHDQCARPSKSKDIIDGTYRQVGLNFYLVKKNGHCLVTRSKEF